MVVGTSGDLQWVVPGRDVMGWGQDARSQPVLWGDRARIHTCKEPNMSLGFGYSLGYELLGAVTVGL